MDNHLASFATAPTQSAPETIPSNNTPSRGLKKPARRDPEARRQQNREASRAYRAKRKQKLALLDQLVPQDPPSSSTSNALPPPSTVEVDRSTGIVNRAVFQASAAIHNHSLNSTLTNHGFDNWSATIPSSRPPESSSHSSSGAWELPDDVNSINPSNLTLHSSTTPSAPPSKPLPPDANLLAVLSHVNTLSPSQKHLLLTHLTATTSPHAREPPRTFTPTTIPGTNFVSHHPRSGHPRSRLQDEARRFAAFIDTHIHANMSPATISKLYVMEVGFYGAVFANCYALGMTDLEGMMVEDGVSPFSLGPDEGYPRSQLGVVRAKFGGITQDLRPSDVQLTFGHHPYLDIIPFKIFREKALQALEQDEGGLDEDQLCTDLGAGGLVCWGSQQNSLGMEAGVPWDVRAWEPQTWFLRKYWHLCGGWEDEMWKSARWWCDTRGQTMDVSETM